MKDLDSKEIWTVNELAEYSGWKLAQIYKMTSNKVLPHSKPTGGKLFFERDKIKAWILSGQVMTIQDVEDKANSYMNKR